MPLKFRCLFILPLVCFLFLSVAHAAVAEGLDSRLEAGGQSFPLGGMLTGKAGYGFTLWHGPAPADKEPEWQYGYIRPGIEVSTAGVANRFTASLDIYPISILGLTAGAGTSQRNLNEFPDVDCKQVQCDHALDFQFVQAQLIAGYEKVALSVIGRYEHFHSNLSTQPFYEEMSYLVGQAENDDLKTLNILAIYTLNEKWSLGSLSIFQKFIYSGNNSSSSYAVASCADGPWRGTIGVGQFQSSQDAAHFSMIFSLQYTGAKSIALFD